MMRVIRINTKAYCSFYDIKIVDIIIYSLVLIWTFRMKYMKHVNFPYETNKKVVK